MKGGRTLMEWMDPATRDGDTSFVRKMAEGHRGSVRTCFIRRYVDHGAWNGK